MNWINNVVRPKIRGLLSATKRETPDNLWVKCPETGQMVFYKDLEANQFVVPGSNFHMRMGADQRLRGLFDGGEFKKVAVPSVPQDPLKFRDGLQYSTVCSIPSVNRMLTILHLPKKIQHMQK